MLVTIKNIYLVYTEQNYKRNTFVFAPIFHELNSRPGNGCRGTPAQPEQRWPAAAERATRLRTFNPGDTQLLRYITSVQNTCPLLSHLHSERGRGC